MKPIKVRFKKLDANAVIPTKAHQTDFGADLAATSCHVDKDSNIVYGFGIAVEIPEGHVGLIFPRSSIAKKHLILGNCVGVLDAGYRGEIMAKFKVSPWEMDKFSYFNYNENLHDLNVYGIGERVAQLGIIPYPEVEYEEAETLSETDRGEGGYGSTGR